MASVLATSTAHNRMEGRAVEDIYQKKTQLEHILLRPDTYVGSIEHQQQALWVHDGERMVNRNVSFVPGLYKIFDEILVNAADNKVRDPSMNVVRVDVDESTGRIKVWNNGSGVPVEMHKKEKVHVPELIFGHLLTSSNYEDGQKKVTGGRNGYGAKLANIFSAEFIVETCDGTRQKRYRQVFSENMSRMEQPRITACKASDNWTCVDFLPDFKRFGMDGLEADIVAMMRKRTYDLSGVLGSTVKVFYNGTRLSVKNFQDYVSLYLGPKDSGAPRVYEKIGDRWEVVVSPTDGQFQQVSFVNSICTLKGGTHVKLVLDQICKHLVDSINKKKKGANVKDFMVRNHLWVFVNCQIENPAFDSQTKETLTLKPSSFGSKCDLSAKFMDSVGKTGVTDSILAFASFKQNKELKKTDGAKRSRLLGIAKLDDANDAGGRASELCTLILTEGDSAKALAISGLSVVGRDRYGVFPLRGKLLNVRDASVAQVNNNAEITALKQIIGLQHGKAYADAKGLRYGKVMIMTDQDQDGSHIKGLIMNYIHHFYPSLLRIPGFLLEFITPIVKATKGRQTRVFYTMPEYEQWKEEAANLRGWTIKYYKGLGTSTSKEAKEYFSELESHRKTFIWEGDPDGEALELAFSKKKVEDRKQWLRDFVPGTFLDHDAEEISFSDFVHRELILFSRADLERSIPSLLDGLKPGQRKVLFSCFKRNLKADIKVAQLAGYVAEHSAYHHGEASLQSTIVNLAQDFVGSNNINLLYPSGQFGTRLQGGKDSASARYIFTRLAPLTRRLFHEDDDALLEYQREEGQVIEPKWYLPILPLVLVNGAEGIGTGWSTTVANHSPRDVAAALRALLQGEEPGELTPWYRGFAGEIAEIPVAGARAASKSYTVTGTVTQTEQGDLLVSELPLRKWTQDYKEYLDGLCRPDEKGGAALVHDYREHHTDTKVSFTITLTDAGIDAAQAKGLVPLLKLQGKMSTGNMMLFDEAGVITKYDSPLDILRAFFPIRLDFYGRRREHLLQRARNALSRISNKVRFILAVVSGELKVSNRKRADIEADLERMQFDRMTKSDVAIRRGAAAAVAVAAATEAPPPGDDEESGEESALVAAAREDGASYEYLLAMAISTLTFEKVRALEAEKGERLAEVARLEATERETLWLQDLDAFEAAYEEWLEAEAAAEADMAAARRAANRKGGKGKVAKKRPQQKKLKLSAQDDEDVDIIDVDDSDDEDFAAAKKGPKKAAVAAKKKAGSKSTGGGKKAEGCAASAAPVVAREVPMLPMQAAPKPEKKPKEPKVGTKPAKDKQPEHMGSPTEGPLGALFAKVATSNPAAASKPAKVAGESPTKVKAKVAAGAAARPGGSPTKAKAATAKRKAPAKKVQDSDLSDEELSTCSESDPPTPTTAAPQKKARGMRIVPAHKGMDKSGAPGSNAENSLVEAPAAAPRQAPRREGARKNYAVNLASEEEASEDGSDGDDDFCMSE